MRAALLLLLALVGLAVGTSEVRNIHQDLTAVSGGVSLEGNREHFFVEVDRIEKELSDDGILLEERDISVALFYDIAEDSSLLVNKVPVPSGFSNIKVEALVRETRRGSEELLEAIKEISVRLFVKREEVLLNTGKTAQHIIIQERVTGIQDTEVWQAEVVEQALVILEDGSVQRLEAVKVNAMFGESRPDIDTPLVDPLPESPVVDPLPNTGTGRPLPQTKPYYHPGHHGKPHHGQPHHGHGHGHGQPHHGKPHHEEEQGEGEGEGATFDGHVGPSEVEEEVHRCLQTVKHYLHEGMHWFHGLPFYLRVLVSFGAGMAAGLIGIGMARCLFGLFNLCCCASSGSKKRQQEEEARKRREEYLRNIKEYSLQYTALPQDEKKEKKEAEQVPLMQV